MRSEDEIKTILKRYENDLKELRQCYFDNEDEELNLLYVREIGIVEGVIQGLKISLGHKKKLKLKSNKTII